MHASVHAHTLIHVYTVIHLGMYLYSYTNTKLLYKILNISFHLDTYGISKH